VPHHSIRKLLLKFILILILIFFLFPDHLVSSPSNDLKTAVEPAPTIRIERHDAKAPANPPIALSESANTSKDLSSSSKEEKNEIVQPDGTRTVLFKNGTQKEIFSDGHVVVTFFNGDIKKSYPNQQVTYYYADAKTTHTSFPDGLEMIEFSNGQLEKRHVDGTQEVVFPDKTVKYVYVNGEEETVFADGTVQRLTVGGERVIEFSNGQREVHTAAYKKRRYPDGTTKIMLVLQFITLCKGNGHQFI
jgi:centromere protein J